MKTTRKVLALTIVLVVIITSVLCLTACNKKKDCDCKPDFELWNDCVALNGLKDYVSKTTNPNSQDFIPVEDRIAVFDMDGTLCGELFPEYLEYLLLEYRCLDDPNYNASDELKAVAQQIRDSGVEYKTPAVDHFDVIHGEAQAKAFAGLTVKEFKDYVKTFLNRDAKGFTGLKYSNSIYKPMIEVVAYLQKNGFTTYVVSGSDRILCRVVACEQLNIPENQIIGMDVTMVASNQGDKDSLDYQFNADGEDKLVRGDELWLKNLKMNKVFNIAQEIGKQPVLSFGNSSGDVSMHEYTISNNKYKAMAFMLIADDTERDHADMIETNKRKASWEEHGYTIISMKNDFKTIYGDGVIKTA
ncbi:MAG: haloacid dehalogenase-like hydrolase [Clostridia bacterium]|nr:haloacid dehalogenase-like hydrolase [Clostridia bacterium]